MAIFKLLVFCENLMLRSSIMEKPKAGYLGHEKWDVYQAGLEFVILMSDIVEHLPLFERNKTDSDTDSK